MDWAEVRINRVAKSPVLDLPDHSWLFSVDVPIDFQNTYGFNLRRLYCIPRLVFRGKTESRPGPVCETAALFILDFCDPVLGDILCV